MKHIAVLIGSPRRNGNTEALVAAFVKGALESGNSVELIRPAELSLHPCIGCNACYRDEAHKCVFDDDMTACYAALANTDVIVVATPIYFYGPSAQIKTLIDRLHNPIRGSFHVKKLALLAVCADTQDRVFDATVTMYQSTLRYFGLEDGGMVTVSGVSEPGQIAGHPLLAKAEALGREI